MKKFAILSLTMFIVTCVNAQKISAKDVPSAATKSLRDKYPTAAKLKWQKENGNYEAEFEIKNTEYSVLIDALGNIIETEVEINKDEFPVAIHTYIAKNYAGQKVMEAAKITDAKGTITYEAEVKGKDLIFDSNGNFIK